MKVYRVYDNELVYIYGSEQLKTFVLEQVREHPDDFLEENGCYEGFSTKKKTQYEKHIKEINDNIKDNGYVNDIDFITWILSVRLYNIEEIQVY